MINEGMVLIASAPSGRDGIFERTKPRALPWAGILRAVGAMKMPNSQLDFVSELETQDTS